MPSDAARRWLRRARLALPLLLVAVAARAAEPVVVERVLAVVDGAPILQSEVRLFERLRGVAREAALAAVVDERLMYQEATRLTRTALTAEQEDAAYRSLLATSPLAVALPEPDLRRLARRQAVILRYVDFRFRPQVRVTDEELRRAFDEQAGGSSAPADFESAAGALREALERRQLDERIEAWVADLRAAADVRVTP